MDSVQLNLLKQYKKVERFEKQLAEYTGAPFVVCVDSCTNALLLSLLYSKAEEVVLPTNTYVGVAMAAVHAGISIKFNDIKWEGMYNIAPTNVYDAAKRFTSNMYIHNTIMCVSFHYKKHLKIGRGGAILLDNATAADWFKLARNCGRNVYEPLSEQQFTVAGYNMLMHPDLAQKGSRLLKRIPRINADLPYEYYGNLKQQMPGVLNQSVFLK